MHQFNDKFKIRIQKKIILKETDGSQPAHQNSVRKISEAVNYTTSSDTDKPLPNQIHAKAPGSKVDKRCQTTMQENVGVCKKCREIVSVGDLVATGDSFLN